MASIMADDDMESFVVLGSSPPSDDSFNSFSLASNRAEKIPQTSLKFTAANSLRSDGNSLMRSALYEPKTEPISAVSSVSPHNFANENGTSSLNNITKTNETPSMSNSAPMASSIINNFNSMTLSKIEFKNDEPSMVSSFAADIILGKMGPKSVQEFSANMDNMDETTDVQAMAATIEKLKGVIRNTNIVMRQHYAKMEEYQAEVNKEKILINEEFKKRGTDFENTNIAMRQHYDKMEQYQAEVNKEKLLINEELKKREADFENLRTENELLKNELVLTNETVIKQNEENITKIEDFQKVIEQNAVIIEKLKANNNVSVQNEIAQIKEEFDLNISIMKKENLDLTKDLSERRSIIKNMTAEIEKLQKLSGNKTLLPIDAEPKILQREHRDIVKSFEDKFKAQQTELNKMKEKYVEEIQCREVHLTEYRERLENLSMDLERTKAANLNLQEQINFSNTQMEVYKSDFMMERQARQEIAAEKELILTDLKMLQRRNQVLTESQSRATDQQQPSAPAMASSSTRPGEPLMAPASHLYQSPNGHVCPLCSVSFSDLPRLEAHVQLCLDQ